MSRAGWRALLVPALIVLGAAALRVWRLDAVPLGLHNDEAWTGIGARAVLREGWVGPYLYPSGLGQPAGPVYLTALLFLVLPQTTFTLRLSMALLGVAAVALTYGAVRAMFDRTTALFAAVLLAIMPWHLQLSRTAFMVNAWPCIEMAVLWALFRVRARPSAWGFAGVGVLIGVGIYTYNAYPLFLPVAATPLAYDLIGAAPGVERRRQLKRIAIVAVAALFAIGLMVDYAARHEEYFWHQHDVSVFFTDAWQAAPWPERIQMIATRGAEWGRGLLFGGRPDNGDGLGASGHPLLDPLTSSAALVGLVMAARFWRRPACGVLLAAVIVLPLGALLTIEDGLYRRTLGLAPFIAVAAALPLAWIWQYAGHQRGVARMVLPAAIVLAVAGAAARNAYAYFGPLQANEQIAYVFPYQIDAAARALAQLPPDAAVFLYSERWGARFETIKWFAPGRRVIDRSREFRKGNAAAAPLDLRIDPRRPNAFVLLGHYLDLVDTLRAQYPNARVEEGERDGELLYRIVRVDGRGDIPTRRAPRMPHAR